MIRITQLKLPVEHDRDQLQKRVCAMLRVKPSRLADVRILRRAVDARKKDDLSFVYTLSVLLKDEKTYTIGKNRNISFYEPVSYRFPFINKNGTGTRPVIIGSGPAGLFCALFLAENGFFPLIIERGPEVTKRSRDVQTFWESGKLDPSSNVQFGEGGAGTFSDGKLNTGISDRSGRIPEVLKIFHRFGAPEEILYDAHPHLGTDLLKEIVRNMRLHIIECGGEFRFNTCISDLLIRNGELTGLITKSGEQIPADLCALAPGHSARDTFLMLKKRGVRISPKPFACGLRVVHEQSLIDRAMWGPAAPAVLGAASYKLSARTADGRGVYSFCMCPGGYVVNASSEYGMLAVNGMSYADRASGFANSAIVSGVPVEDYAGETDPVFREELSGIAFQRRLEAAAYLAGAGAIPVQEYGDFRNRQKKEHGIPEAVLGRTAWADLSGILPVSLYQNILTGMARFGKILEGFDDPSVLMLGVESRTSSPVRIERDESLQSSLRGLYPCGEGAGYAGGITSAAVDGIRTAEAVAKAFLQY